MTRVLQASFVRVRGQHDRIYVRRSNGSEVAWRFPTYGDELPHDLVHLVVESAFGVRQGFWGRVDGGVDPARINDEANRMWGADKYRGFGEDRRELLLAEGLAGLPWSDASLSEGELRGIFVERCGQAGVAAAEGMTAERVAAVRRALDGLRAQWRGLGAKGTLRLTFRPEDPAIGFEELLAET